MITLNFNNPETEKGFLARAQASGMSLEDYLLTVVPVTQPPPQQEHLSPEERALAFEAWATSHRPTTPLSDFAVSRESIYERRGV
jgi:hypothetical protein